MTPADAQNIIRKGILDIDYHQFRKVVGYQATNMIGSYALQADDNVFYLNVYLVGSYDVRFLSNKEPIANITSIDNRQKSVEFYSFYVSLSSEKVFFQESSKVIQAPFYYRESFTQVVELIDAFRELKDSEFLTNNLPKFILDAFKL